LIEFFSSLFHYTFAAHPPVLRVAPGTTLQVICPDSDNAMSDGTLLPQQRRHPASGGWQGNPVAGPIFLEGAEPGHCLVVRIDTIHLDRATGQTGLAPNHGLISNELLAPSETHNAVPRHLFRWSIDAKAGVARLINPLGSQPLVVPLNPFVGCIGVCPPERQELTTLYSGPYGGNMDLPLTRAGATVFLPVFESGALLALGDIHAAQGHGEIIGGAVETSGRIDCTIGLRRNWGIGAPRIVDATHLAAVGLDADLKQAIARAYAHLLEWVVADWAMNRWDAYNLISQCGSIVLGNLLVAPYPVAACLPRAVLADRERTADDVWL
jgi:amidase